MRRHGLAFPEAVEDFPWEDHPVLKVRGRIFVFLGEEDGFSMTVKLPVSRDFAETFDFAAPAGYGLGRSGWITARFPSGEVDDLDLLKRWLAESYRAIAPKKLAALLSDENDAFVANPGPTPYALSNSKESGTQMSTHHDFYLERAAEARRDAESTPLQNVRDRCLRAAEAWEQMAARVERTGRMRAETEAKKAAALAELQ